MAMPRLSRRSLLRTAFAGGAAAVAGPLLAAPSTAREIRVAQIVDVSNAQQDVSKDVLIGARAYWQDFKSRRTLHGGVSVSHMTFETDGSPGQLKAAVKEVVSDPNIVVLQSTAGEAAALAIVDELARLRAPLAHAAPWLQNSVLSVDERTFPIFASRQDQLAHTLRALIGQGVHEAGVIYATENDERQYGPELQRIAAALNLRLRTFGPVADLTQLGRRLTPETPAILVFMGGTPEIIAFMQGLDAQQRQRYLVGLADVNLQTVAQIGTSRKTPLIATQVVPAMSSPIPIVRGFRAVLTRLFEEVPTSLSLAGFIGSHYVQEVLSRTSGVPTRASVLAEFQRREELDLGGFRVAYQDGRRGSRYVSQTMLTADGRLIS